MASFVKVGGMLVLLFSFVLFYVVVSTLLGEGACGIFRQGGLPAPRGSYGCPFCT